MKERNNNQPEGVFLPPAWCGAICRNAMNEVCIEHCAIKRDCSGFEEKPNLKLSDMPRFPKTHGMTKEEKFTSVTVYLAKVVDHLSEVKATDNTFAIRPPARSEAVVKPQAISEVLAGIQETTGTEDE